MPVEIAEVLTASVGAKHRYLHADTIPEAYVTGLPLTIDDNDTLQPAMQNNREERYHQPAWLLSHSKCGRKLSLEAEGRAIYQSDYRQQ
jgi:hypothetical protein